MLAKIWAMPRGRLFTAAVYPFFVWAMYQDVQPADSTDLMMFVGAMLLAAVFGAVMIVEVVEPFNTFADRLVDRLFDWKK